MGLLDYHTSDGCCLFVLPWLNHTLIDMTNVPGPAQILWFLCVLEEDDNE